MTLDHAAQAAADRDLAEGEAGWDCTRFEIYVRAFRQGAQWQRDQIWTAEEIAEVKQRAHERWLRQGLTDEEMNARVETLTNSPSPSTGSTAPSDTAESEHRGKS